MAGVYATATINRSLAFRGGHRRDCSYMMFLSQCELDEMTGKKRRSSQASELRTLGITFKTRADGSLVVLRAHVEQVLGLRQSTGANTSEEKEPNWAVMKTFGRNMKNKT